MPLKHYTRKVNKKPTDIKQAQWSDKQKFDAVTTYLMVGKWALVSEATGIPIDTLKKWRYTQWWKEIEEEIRRTRNIESSSKLIKIAEKAASVVADRLEHGDYVLDRHGEIRRVPVNAKTAGDLMVKAIDKDLLLQKLEEAPTLKEDTIIDRLNAIAQELKKHAKKPTNIIDVQPIEEITDEFSAKSEGVFHEVVQEEPEPTTSSPENGS